MNSVCISINNVVHGDPPRVGWDGCFQWGPVVVVLRKCVGYQARTVCLQARPFLSNLPGMSMVGELGCNRGTCSIWSLLSIRHSHHRRRILTYLTTSKLDVTDRSSYHTSFPVILAKHLTVVSIQLAHLHPGWDSMIHSRRLEAIR